MHQEEVKRQKLNLLLVKLSAISINYCQKFEFYDRNWTYQSGVDISCF